MTLRSNTELDKIVEQLKFHKKTFSNNHQHWDINTLHRVTRASESSSVEGSLLLTEVLIRYPLIAVGIMGLWSLILVFFFLSVFVSCWYLPPSRAPLLLTQVLSPSCGLVRTGTSVGAVGRNRTLHRSPLSTCSLTPTPAMFPFLMYWNF